MSLQQEKSLFQLPCLQRKDKYKSPSTGHGPVFQYCMVSEAHGLWDNRSLTLQVGIQHHLWCYGHLAPS